MIRKITVAAAAVGLSVGPAFADNEWLGVWTAKIVRHIESENKDALICSNARQEAQRQISDAGGALSRFGECLCERSSAGSYTVGTGAPNLVSTECRQEVWYKRDEMIRR